ncbi:hypothetical protein PROFUN_07455 [Planoprotostelium fungivorum]|uniref:Uncharacterized protein n=1 Tax=Planoprotostelium fungivorum TaxID=1890364 RepID=A0A2P6NLG2_9EUKA|nr:hypothetical protein PROFUN_07455 [Planoprotostelium fungivorum]
MSAVRGTGKLPGIFEWHPSGTIYRSTPTSFSSRVRAPRHLGSLHTVTTRLSRDQEQSEYSRAFGYCDGVLNDSVFLLPGLRAYLHWRLRKVWDSPLLALSGFASGG